MVVLRVIIWTVALMSGITSIAREWVATFAPGAITAPSLFDACLVTSFVLSCGYAWYIEHREGKQLKRDLEKERENLSDAPQITLRHEKTGSGVERFFVHNSGTDGTSAQLEPAESVNYMLTSDVIQHIQGGSDMPLTLHLEPKHPSKEYRRIDGIEAWHTFALDVWVETHPHDKSTVGVRLIERIVSETLTQQLVVGVTLSYGDLSGKRFRSPSKIVWDPIFNSVQEVRPGTITKQS